LPGGGTDLAGGTTEDPAGTVTFFGCLGFFCSLLLRCWPLGISISLGFERTLGALHLREGQGERIMALRPGRAMLLAIVTIATFSWPHRRRVCILHGCAGYPIRNRFPKDQTMLPNAKDLEGKPVPKVTFKTRVNEKWKDVSSDALFKGKTVVLFSLPGAYTPTCSSTHLPRYNELASALKTISCACRSTTRS
jgi:hypothetical protein